MCFLRFQPPNHQITDFIHFSDDPVVTIMENSGIRILVDGNNLVAVCDSCHVVHCTGDSERKIQLWLYHHTRLPDHQLER